MIKESKRKQIKSMIVAGIKTRDVAEAMKCSEGFVCKLQRELRAPTSRKCSVCGAQVPGHLYFLCDRCYKNNAEGKSFQLKASSSLAQ